MNRIPGGVRLKPASRRLSVHGLRERFAYLFRRVLTRWRFSYGRALRSLKKGIKRNQRRRHSSSSRRRCLMETSSESGDCRCVIRRSNSFYSEAIADCLEFIKRSSLSVDQKSISQR